MFCASSESKKEKELKEIKKCEDKLFSSKSQKCHIFYIYSGNNTRTQKCLFICFIFPGISTIMICFKIFPSHGMMKW